MGKKPKAAGGGASVGGGGTINPNAMGEIAAQDGYMMPRPRFEVEGPVDQKHLPKFTGGLDLSLPPDVGGGTLGLEGSFQPKIGEADDWGAMLRYRRGF